MVPARDQRHDGDSKGEAYPYIDAGRILEGRGTLPEVGDEIVALVEQVAAGMPTVSEALGHQEFVLGYKSFEPVGPACHPASA